MKALNPCFSVQPTQPKLEIAERTVFIEVLCKSAAPKRVLVGRAGSRARFTCRLPGGDKELGHWGQFDGEGLGRTSPPAFPCAWNCGLTRGLYLKKKKKKVSDQKGKICLESTGQAGGGEAIS